MPRAWQARGRSNTRLLNTYQRTLFIFILVTLFVVFLVKEVPLRQGSQELYGAFVSPHKFTFLSQLEEIELQLRETRYAKGVRIRLDDDAGEIVLKDRIFAKIDDDVLREQQNEAQGTADVLNEDTSPSNLCRPDSVMQLFYNRIPKTGSTSLIK